MVERVLLVDDEEALLKAYRRFLQAAPVSGAAAGRRDYEIETASSPQDALDLIATHGPFAVVVSDYKMPGMDGVRFLERVKTLEPSTVRVMLTGVTDINTAIESVNCGAVFRFLTKPCLPTTLSEAVAAALRQHQLIVAERELLEETVGGVVRVLMDTLTLLNPSVSNRAYRVRRFVRHIVTRCGLSDAWQLEVAAMLSQFGSVVLGTDVATGDSADHPDLARRLLGHIPRFEEVAEIIARQREPLDPRDLETPLTERDRIRLGGQVLRVALEFDAATAGGQRPADAIVPLLKRSAELEPLLLRCLADVDADLINFRSQTITLHALRAGMILDEDLKGENGVLVMVRGHEVTEALLARMQRMASIEWLRTTTVRVLAPEWAEFEPLPKREGSFARPLAGGAA